MLTIPGFHDATRAFFARDPLLVAPQLLGCVLERSTAEGTVAIQITEVEAYAGELDPGAHSHSGMSARTAVTFGEAGHLYCYFSYGMHWAINVVTGETGQSRGCLIRAGRVIVGDELARARRAVTRRSPIPDRELARGPACVAQVFGVGAANNGDDLFAGEWRFAIPDGPLDEQVAVGPRVGVSGPGGDAAAFPWRYWIAGDPTVSAYKPGKPIGRVRTWTGTPATSADTPPAQRPR